MLNPKTNERELAYVVYVDEIKPIPGRDRVECARVGGWTCMVPKGAFKPGDPGIYFEIDSKVPTNKEPFGFCEKYKGHIKTQKFKTPEGQFWSQGLLMAAADFGWTIDRIDEVFITDDKMVRHIPGTESAFLTKQLGVTYYEVEDNKRKAASPDKYKKMAARHPKLFQKPFIKWLYKKTWGRKVLFLFLGKKKDKRGWPAWVVKTDEERIENLPHWLQNKNPWIATEKIDGTSTTFTLHRGKYLWSKNEYFVCSRNVCFDTPNKECYYDQTAGNVYLEMSEKYNMEDVLTKLLNMYPDAQWVTVQGETYGASVQKRDYSMKDRDFAAFNLVIDKIGRFNTVEMTKILTELGIPCVPIISENYILPDTIDELRDFVDSQGSAIDNKMKEGIVFRSLDGVQSFKCVSPSFLLKFHS